MTFTLEPAAFFAQQLNLLIRRKVMIASYGETSGFAPIASEELEKVNGGGAINLYLFGVYVGTISPVAGAVIVIGAAALTVGVAVASSKKSK
jgi:hypothetical protein